MCPRLIQFHLPANRQTADCTHYSRDASASGPWSSTCRENCSGPKPWERYLPPASGLTTEKLPATNRVHPAPDRSPRKGKAVVPDRPPHARRQPCEKERVLPWSPPMARVKSRNRKSTRLNSSHTVISYAVFCLKKKKIIFIMCSNFILRSKAGLTKSVDRRLSVNLQDTD